MAQPVAVYTDAAEEHLATRRSCGLFDFSFMSHFEIAGANARVFLDRLQTRNLAGLAPGRIAYTLLLRPDGTVFIDATVWCLAPDRYWLFTGRRSDFAFVAEAVREEGVDAARSLGRERRACAPGAGVGASARAAPRRAAGNRVLRLS